MERPERSKMRKLWSGWSRTVKQIWKGKDLLPLQLPGAASLLRRQQRFSQSLR